MDITLREYLTTADQIHDYVDRTGVILPSQTLEEKILQLQTAVKNIQAIAKRIADVSNVCNQILLYRKRQGTYLDPYPSENDHVVLRTKYPAESVSLVGFDLPCTVVETAADIPVSSLYYIKQLGQFALNVNGVVIRGSLGNVVERSAENSARCEYGTECKSLLRNGTCKYYHDPTEYLKVGKPIADVTRNFTVGSWLYCSNSKPSRYYTRHVGSRDTLQADLTRLKKSQYRDEIFTREGQLAHDLLVYLILNNAGLCERYRHWL